MVERILPFFEGVAIAGFFGWQHNVPVVHDLVQQVNHALSPFTLPFTKNLRPRKPGPWPFVQPRRTRLCSFRSLDDADSDPGTAFHSRSDPPGRTGGEND
jgi:hypothetical protein